MTDLPPKRLIWIASYPKSGSTWTRHFLASLLTGGPVEFKEFNRTYTCSIGTLYERYGDGSSLDDVTNALKQRVAVQRGLNADCSDYLFIKTHAMYGAYAPQGSSEPILLFDRESAVGAILLVRNPFDVAASFSNHLEFSVDHAVDMMLRPNAILGASKGAVPTVMGSWPNNLTSWVTQPHFPVSIFRYEDLLLEPQQTFSVLASQAANVDDQERVKAAIDATSFSNLQEREAVEKLPETSGHASKFFWKGRIGHGFEALTPKHVEKIWAACGETARAFGYDFNGEELLIHNVPALKNVERRTHRFPAMAMAREESAATPGE